MKRIQLADSLPASIIEKGQSPKVIDLLEKIRVECNQTGLSYIEINKALYLADKEFYIKALTSTLDK